MNFKKYWYWYLLAAAAAGYVITSLVKEEWNPMNWLSPGTSGERKRFSQCINGTLYISACPSCPSAAAGSCSNN